MQFGTDGSLQRLLRPVDVIIQTPRNQQLVVHEHDQDNCPQERERVCALINVQLPGHSFSQIQRGSFNDFYGTHHHLDVLHVRMPRTDRPRTHDCNGTDEKSKGADQKVEKSCHGRKAEKHFLAGLVPRQTRVLVLSLGTKVGVDFGGQGRGLSV